MYLCALCMYVYVCVCVCVIIVFVIIIVVVVIIIIIIIISVRGLGHFLTRSGLTYPEISSKVRHDSFCQLGNSVSLPWVIYYGAFYLHVVSPISRTHMPDVRFSVYYYGNSRMHGLIRGLRRLLQRALELKGDNKLRIRHKIFIKYQNQ